MIELAEERGGGDGGNANYRAGGRGEKRGKREEKKGKQKRKEMIYRGQCPWAACSSYGSPCPEARVQLLVHCLRPWSRCWPLC